MRTVPGVALRHAFGTRLGESVERLEVIVELMGHSDVEITRIYVHPSLETKKQAVRKVLGTTWSQSKEQGNQEKVVKS